MEDMQAEGVLADTIMYCAAISACEKGGQWQRALQLMEDVQAEGIPAGAITYSAAISACENGRRWQQALHLMGNMQAEGIPADTNTYKMPERLSLAPLPRLVASVMVPPVLARCTSASPAPKSSKKLQLIDPNVKGERMLIRVDFNVPLIRQEGPHPADGGRSS